MCIFNNVIWTIKTYFISIRTSLKIMIIYGSVVVHSVHFSEGFVTLINTGNLSF